MIGVLCIVLPLLVAAALPWTPGARWLSLGAAALDLVLAASLPWTGSTLDGWLLPEALVVLVMVLTGFAWVMASLATTVPVSVAALVGLLNLALLVDGAGLTAVALGGAGVVAVLGLRLAERGPLLAAAASGAGLAVFGTLLLYVGTLPALGPGWAALSWSALPGASARATAMPLSAGFVLLLLGSGVSCLLVPLWAALRGATLPPALAMLAGPMGGAWLVTALRLRGVLDGHPRVIAPGAFLLAAGLAGLVLSVVCLRRPAALLPAASLAVFAVVLVGFGIGGAGATQAALLHLTLGCLALTAAGTGARLGLAALAGLPPLGVFASGFALIAEAASRNGIVAAILALGLFVVAALALRVVAPGGPDARLGWVGVGLTLVGAWAMPPAITAWLHGIAAAAR